MQEARRQAYLQVLGVTSWVPRQPLSGAARGRRPLMASAPLEQAPGLGEPVKPSQPAPVVQPSELAVPRNESGAEAARLAILAPRQGARVGSASAAPAVKVTQPPEPVEVQDQASQSCPSFAVQLWLAGPCALLLEVPAQGLGARSPGARLLADILRAVQLPAPARFIADFKWPLTRNAQLDQSEMAAHQALQAFVQGRLEQHSLVSLGSFGQYAGLLAKASLTEVSVAIGREEALDGLPPAWFAPGLDELLQSPAGKADLWALLQRVMVRWQAQ